MKQSPLLIAAYMLQPAANAQKFENLDVLDQRIAIATDSIIGSPGGAVSPLDRRLSMPACASQVDITRIDHSSLALYCAGPTWRIRVPLVANAIAETLPLEPQNLNKPIVRRGDIVEARYEADDFDLSLMMVALENGTEGETIRVKNVETGRQTSAVVTRLGEVSIFP